MSEMSGADGFPVHYHIVENRRPERDIQVYAEPEEIAQLVDQGYLVRECLFHGEALERLRQALNSQADEELGVVGISTSASFGGIFLRHLMDKRPEFLELLRFAPLLSIARAVLGPQVRVLPLTARIAVPGQPNQETEWHFHQRLIPEPYPPFFARPHVLDCLIYLDDVTEENGPLCVVPGSHYEVHQRIPESRWDDLPGQIQLKPSAGSCVIVHGGLWHRALPTRPEGTPRRLLILPYTNSWIQLPSHGERPANSLMRPLYESNDPEIHELIGDPKGLL